MRLAFALLLMTTTLGAGTAVFASAPNLPPMLDAGLGTRTAPDTSLMLVDDDGDDDEGGWFWSRSDDDDDEDDDDCDEDDDDDDCTAAATGTAARAGTASPPKNGLFTDGTAPVVKSN